MKKLSILVLSIAALGAVCSCGNKSGENLQNGADSLCYSFGVLQGSNLAEAKAMGYYPELNDLDVDQYLAGVKEGGNVNDQNTSYYMGLQDGVRMKKAFDRMSEQLGLEANFDAFMAAYSKAVKGDSTLVISKLKATAVSDSIMEAARLIKEKAVLDSIAATPEAIANQEAGMAFLAAKEQEEGVQKTASGLLYKVVKEGKGEKFKATDRVELSYVGKFINDSIFDQSDNAKFMASQVVPGFGEGLQLMSPGAKYILYIPSELAYGILGKDNKIPYNSTLIFEIETRGVASAQSTMRR